MFPKVSKHVDDLFAATWLADRHMAKFPEAAENIPPITGTNEENTDEEAEAKNCDYFHGHYRLQHVVDFAAGEKGNGNEQQTSVSEPGHQPAIGFTRRTVEDQRRD